jgi:cytochrome c553
MIASAVSTASGERGNDMREIADRLTDAEIVAAAKYYAAMQ